MDHDPSRPHPGAASGPRWDRRALLGFVAAPLLALTATLAWTLSVADRLPDPVAVHVGAAGEADGFGAVPGLVIAVAAVTVTMILLMGLLGARRRSPRILRRMLGPAAPVFTGFTCGFLSDIVVPQLDATSAEAVAVGSAWTIAGTLAGLAVGAVTAMALADPRDPAATEAPGPSLPRGPRSSPVRVTAPGGVTAFIVAYLAMVLASLALDTGLFLLLALSSCYVVQLRAVRVRVDGDGVHLRMLLGETIPLETITGARPTTYHWGDGGGIGIRQVWHPGDRGRRLAVAVRSGEAVDVGTTGRDWTIVVPDGTAERIAGDINARLDALHGGGRPQPPPTRTPAVYPDR